MGVDTIKHIPDTENLLYLPPLLLIYVAGELQMAQVISMNEQYLKEKEKKLE